MSDSVVVDNLSISYEALADSGRFRRRRVQVPALCEISFALLDGDAVGIIGHNGSGKSTLLQAVAGLVPPTSGSVMVSSQPQLLGVNAALNNRLSGHANIELCCLALGFEPRKVPPLAEEIAEFTELGDFLDLPATSYSTGMRQRLAFAISMIARPEILLIDEALAVGDQRFKDRCLAKLREIRADAGTVLLATHAMQEISATCNKALWLHEGKLHRFGEPDAIIEEYLEDRREVNRRL